MNDYPIGMHLNKQNVISNKAIYIGQCVLDKSENLMNDWYYNEMLAFGSLNLLFTGTDNLCYQIKNLDPFKLLYNTKQLLLKLE